jgi:hypothetical protein
MHDVSRRQCKNSTPAVSQRAKPVPWYRAAMANEQNSRPVDRREERNRSQPRLTDEQLAEVRRRRAEDNPKTMTLAKFNEHLRQRYGV